MAPEQLEGKDADARTDIFALGVVIYEMVTGRKAFEGATQASLIAAILSREPRAMSALQPLSPPALDRVVAKCLAKDPHERWQTAKDLYDELAWIIGAPIESQPRSIARPATGQRLAWTAAGVLAFTLTASWLLGALYLRRPAPELPATRLEVVTPPAPEPVSLAISPDGRQLVFLATKDQVSELWLRPLDQPAAQPLAGTEDASYPFWAPDSRAIGFFANGKLKRIDLAGGVPRVVADAPVARGGTWSPDDVILFAPTQTGGLMRVAASGGAVSPATDLTLGQNSHRWPQFLPDGRRFIFVAALGRQDSRGVST
jgi:hypothetical protein